MLRVVGFLVLVTQALTFCPSGEATMFAVASGGGGGEADPSPSALFTINLTDGSTTFIGNFGGDYVHTTGLAAHPLTGVLHANDNGDGAALANSDLLIVSHTDGSATLVGNTSNHIPDLAYTPDGTLLAWAERNSTVASGLDALIQINTATAQTTQLGGGVFGTGGTGLAVDQQNQIWLKTDTHLFKLDATGNEQSSVELEGVLGKGNFLAVDPSGTLWSGTRISSQNQTQLVTLDPDGTVSIEWTLDDIQITAITFRCNSFPGTISPVFAVFVIAFIILAVAFFYLCLTKRVNTWLNSRMPYYAVMTNDRRNSPV